MLNNKVYNELFIKISQGEYEASNVKENRTHGKNALIYGVCLLLIVFHFLLM